jgi:hypothetical protein
MQEYFKNEMGIDVTFTSKYRRPMWINKTQISIKVNGRENIYLKISQPQHRNHQISAIKKLASYIRTTVGVNLLYRGYGLDPALEALLKFQDIPACEPIFDMSTFTE